MTAKAWLTLGMHRNELKSVVENSCLCQCYHATMYMDGKGIALVVYHDFQAQQNAVNTSK